MTKMTEKPLKAYRNLIGVLAMALLMSMAIPQELTALPASNEQQQAISGTIIDAEGLPMGGVTVAVVGTQKGTMSDFDGNYTLSAKSGDVLRFSFIGYKTQDITVANNTVINLTLEEDISALDEVIVLGYNAVEKRKVTGSVASVNTDELNEISSTSLGNAVAGRIAGVSITQTGGRPGRTSDIIVRGATVQGFSGTSSPLYVIDGVVGSKQLFDALDVSEVETVSVLKDAAAAAVYGARASNGVILVTTRKGRGAPKIVFTSTLGTTEPTQNPEFNSAYEHALLMNSTLDWNNAKPDDAGYITDKELDYLKTLPNKSFIDEFAKTPILNRNAVTISGSSDRVSYFLAGSIVKQTAAFENMSYNKNNLRGKVDVDITDNLNVGLNISTSKDQDEGFYWRHNNGDEDYGDFYRTALRSGKWGPATKNGMYVANFNGWNAGNIIDNGAGSQTRDKRLINSLITLDYKVPFVKGLSAGLSFNRNTVRNDRHLFRKTLVDYTFATDPNNRFLLTDEIIGERARNDDGADSDSVYESASESENYQLNAKLNYNNTFGLHSVSAFAVYEQAESEYKEFYGIGREVTSELIPTINGTNSDERRAGGYRTEGGRLSAIGGIAYDYDGKYLISSNFRYDGSTKFAEDRRFGFFPSLSVGWVLSKEAFFENTFGFFDFFKLRYSIGLTGDDSVSSGYPYLQSYTLGTGAVFGTDENITSSTLIGPEATPFITWNKQTSYNFGVNFVVLNNRWETSFDVFKNKKRDLYGTRQLFIPESSGLTLSPENYGGIDISGYELLSTFRDRLNDDISYEVGFNLGYATSKYAVLDEPESTLPHLSKQGQALDRIRTYVADGIIRTQDQLDQLLAEGYTQFGRAPRIGELLYKDIRGDRNTDPDQNTPDGKVDANDLEYIEGAHSSPPVNYGIRLGFRYKNFHLQAFAQGFAGHQRFMPQAARFNLGSVGNADWAIWNDSWTPENPNASYPVFGGDEGWQYKASTFFLRDADFLRLKQLNLAYDVPKNWVEKIGAKHLSVFVNTDNPLMIYSKIKEFDPETSGRGIPVNRSFSVGLNLTF